MNYLLVMSLSGSCLYLFYLCINKFWGKHMLKRWEYILLKITILYYLLPIPFLKKVYVNFGKRFIGYDPLEKGIIEMKYVILKEGENLYYNDNYKRQLMVGIIWCIGAAIVFLVYLLKYLKFRRRVMRCCVCVNEDPAIYNILKILKKEYGIRRKVSVLSCSAKTTPFTTGIFKPIIIFNHDDDKNELEVILRHELVHIKRFDPLVSVLKCLAGILHWYNPLAFLLKTELERVCEVSCDEIVVKDMNPEQRTWYAKLLVSQGRKAGMYSIYANPLTNEGKSMEERIIFIMKDSKGKKMRSGIISGIVVCIAVALCSVTVLAYEDVTTLGSARVEPGEELENRTRGEWTFSLPEYEDEFSDIDEFLYNQQFTDEDGKVFPINENMNTYAVCTHSYVAGTSSYHDKTSGSNKCTVSKYNARRCTKCGYVNKLSLISQNIYNPCPH